MHLTNLSALRCRLLGHVWVRVPSYISNIPPHIQARGCRRCLRVESKLGVSHWRDVRSKNLTSFGAD